MANVASGDASFYRNLSMKLLLGLVCMGTAMYSNHRYEACFKENLALQKQYAAEASWLKTFDYDRAAKTKELFLKPCRAQDIPQIIQSRIEILKSAGLEVRLIRNLQSKPASLKKQGALKTAACKVTVSGDWEKLKQALNKLEKDAPVVITSFSSSMRNQELLTDLEFSVYYL